MAEDPHEKREPGAEHRKLDLFVGRWRVEGFNAGQAPDAPDTKVSGEESYEWLPGRFFLLTHFDRGFTGGGRHIGTGLIGVGERGTYASDSFDNLGYHRTYKLSVEDRVWTYSGGHERAQLTFAKDGKSFHVKWELSKDGKAWQPLCELDGTKLT